MRIFPRLGLPRLKRLRNRVRRLRRHLSVTRVAVLIEVLIFTGCLLFAITGRRGSFLDRMGRRSDLVIFGVLLLLCVLLHRVIARRVLPRIERYFLPMPYDERRILFNLGQEARRATNVDQLYQAIANRIKESLEAGDVSIFVRDENSADYICRVSSSQGAPFEQVSVTNGEDSLSRSTLKLARDAFVVKRLKSLANPLVLEAAEFEIWTRAFATAPATLREARQRERDTLEKIRSHLLVQVRTKDVMIGILSLGLRRAQFQYSAADKEVLMSIAGQLALVIENSRLAERMVAEERLRRELALAAEVQRRLLPASPPENIPVELAGFCQPASGVGGDYYDFITFENDQLGIAIADVAGKGMAAALLMSTVQATLRSLSARDSRNAPSGSLADMVATLNRLLCNSTGQANYVTFFYAQFDQRTQRLVYVNAGHNPPFILRANGSESVTQLSSGGMVVGMFEHSQYEQGTVQMQSGDLLLAFTDGLSEAFNVRGEEFGETRIRGTLFANTHLPVNEIRDELVREVKVWCSGAPQSDDLTFIVMKVK